MNSEPIERKKRAAPRFGAARRLLGMLYPGRVSILAVARQVVWDNLTVWTHSDREIGPRVTWGYPRYPRSSLPPPYPSSLRTKFGVWFAWDSIATPAC